MRARRAVGIVVVMSSSSQVALTGVTGFVGTALAARLREAGFPVRGLARPTSDPGTVAWLERLGVEIVRGDVTDAASLVPLLDGADLAIHSAAVIAYRRRMWGTMAHVNVIGTRHVVRACLALDVRRLVHVSSIAAVGVTDGPTLMDEGTTFNAQELDAAYFDTKHQAEIEVGGGLHRGLDAVVVNPGAIYGASAAKSNSSRVIAEVARRRPGLVPRGGINVVPLETVVQGVLAAADFGRRAHRYILGGENLELRELVVRIGRAAGVDLTPKTFGGAWRGPLRAALNVVEPLVPSSTWYAPDMCAVFGRYMWFDTTRMQTELGIEPGGVDRCLEETVEQLRRDGALPRA